MLVQSLSSGLIYIGNMRAQTANRSAAGNNQQGTAYQAQESFIANRMFIRGSNFSSWTCNFILCIYDATDLTHWSGALVGKTVVAAELLVDTLVELALVAPVSIVEGNWYALTILPDTPGLACGSSIAIAGGDRFFGDSYSDGPAGTAGASALNAVDDERCIWATN